MNQLAPSQVSALSRLFSSGVFKELATMGRSPLFARLSMEVLEGGANKCERVIDFLDFAFQELKRTECRHEYIYKAAITEKILLGTHSLRTASMMTEFRVGSSKADVVILNGTASVYEIKSERDSLARLETQIINYKKVFASVNVIAGENHIEAVRSLVPQDVGLLGLSRRYQISTIREAIRTPEQTSPKMIFESIRRNEAIKILQLLSQPVPDVTNIEMHSALRDRYETLDSADVHRAMVEVLKKTRNLSPLSELVSKTPNSLRSAVLSYPLKRKDHARLLEAIEVPFSTALQWG